MAGSFELKLLRKGAEGWNLWRREGDPYDPPDLSDADLSGLDLRDFNFLITDLSGANLTQTNLSRAFLSNSYLSRANFQDAMLIDTNFRESFISNASFRRAELNGAIFNDARVDGADFRESRLYRAKFINTNLVGAKFSRAKLGNTIFGRCEISGATGLGSCSHDEPSILDVPTIAKSGPLPIRFLRGCGLPEDFIQNLSIMTVDPLQTNSCFISYSSIDDQFARKLHSDLQQAGVRCWFAPHDLRTGDKIRQRIDESIGVYDKLLLVLSKHSVQSDWVEQEVETALARERREKTTILFPIRLDDAIMEYTIGWQALIKNSRHIGDFRRWKKDRDYKPAFNRLVKDLAHLTPLTEQTSDARRRKGRS